MPTWVLIVGITVINSLIFYPKERYKTISENMKANKHRNIYGVATLIYIVLTFTLFSLNNP